MTGTARWTAGVLAVLAAAAGSLAAPGTPASPACPIRAAVSGENQTPQAYAAAALAAAEHPDRACRAAALAAMAVSDRSAAAACAALDRIDLGVDIGGVAGAASLEAELAWRCGRPRRAHEAALRALRAEPGSVLAQTVLARTLEARLRTEAARTVFSRALEAAPRAVEPLRGMARLSADRKARRGYLERYLDAAAEAGEPWERRRAVLDSIALDRELAGRELWTIEKAELPATIRLRAVASRPGFVSAWLMRCAVGERDRVPALLDSGASGLHLAERAARRAEMTPLTGGTLFGGGGDDRHSVERGIVSRLDFGPLVYGEALGVAAAGDLHPRGRYRAIVGMDLFSGLRLVLDPDERELWLLEAEAPAQAGEPVGLDPWPRERDRAPILRVAGQLLVPVEVRDAEGRHPREVLALFDTGAQRSMIAPGLAEAIGGGGGSWGRSLRGYGGGLDVRGAVGRIDVTVAGRRIALRDVPVVADLELRGQLGGTQVAAILGMDAFSRRRLVIDLAEGWVSLSTQD
jgi:tetratricopeptide (TPR) repeat protein